MPYKGTAQKAPPPHLYKETIYEKFSQSVSAAAILKRKAAQEDEARPPKRLRQETKDPARPRSSASKPTGADTNLSLPKTQPKESGSKRKQPNEAETSSSKRLKRAERKDGTVSLKESQPKDLKASKKRQSDSESEDDVISPSQKRARKATSATQSNQKPLGKKRSSDSGTENEVLSPSHKRARKGPTQSKQKPLGIVNYHCACFANAVIQALDALPISEKLAELRARTVQELDDFASQHKDVLGCPATLELSKAKTAKTVELEKRLRQILRRHADDLSLGAYLGNILHQLHAGHTSPSSYLFLQVCGALSKHFGTEVYDGKTQQDCVGFLDGLVSGLCEEEEGSSDEQFAIREQFALRTKTEVSFRFLSSFLF